MWAGLGRHGRPNPAHIPVIESKNDKDIEIKQAVIVFYCIENIDTEIAILKNLVKSSYSSGSSY